MPVEMGVNRRNVDDLEADAKSLDMESVEIKVGNDSSQTALNRVPFQESPFEDRRRQDTVRFN
jgi:hypothetical protein